MPDYRNAGLPDDSPQRFVEQGVCQKCFSVQADLEAANASAEQAWQSNQQLRQENKDLRQQIANLEADVVRLSGPLSWDTTITGNQS